MTTRKLQAIPRTRIWMKVGVTLLEIPYSIMEV